MTPKPDENAVYTAYVSKDGTRAVLEAYQLALLRGPMRFYVGQPGAETKVDCDEVYQRPRQGGKFMEYSFELGLVQRTAFHFRAVTVTTDELQAQTEWPYCEGDFPGGA